MKSTSIKNFINREPGGEPGGRFCWLGTRGTVLLVGNQGDGSVGFEPPC